MYSKEAWVLVQPQVIPDPDYLPDYLFLMTMIERISSMVDDIASKIEHKEDNGDRSQKKKCDTE